MAGYGVIALALLGTLGVNLYTWAQVERARTSMLWADQWVIVQDLEQLAQGHPLWPILWSPYWGHRLVIPRLLFLADARWLSLASLTWLTLLVQFVHIALLIALAWLLLRRKSLALFLIGTVVILNMMLSPFQMENFVWGMQTMFPLVFMAATAACLSLSLASADNRRPFLLLCIVLGMVSSYSMPNGILVWPALVVQSIYLKQSRRVVLSLAGLGTVVIASYLWHYTRPLEMGMGGGGILRHPMDAILLLGLIVGSAFRFTIPWDVAVGVAAIAVSAAILIHALFARRNDRRWFSALFGILLFLLLSSMSLVAGRLTSKDLHFEGKDLLPVRYFTMICLFWASLALLALSTSQGRRLRALALCFYGVLLAVLMFTSVVRQLTEAEDWADFFVGADAMGSALILDVPDEQLLSLFWPNQPEREERTLFLRQHRLALFHEPRADWPGKRISELFPFPPHSCEGALEKMVALDGSSWRVEGWAWDAGAASSPDDILFADPTGRVIGLARGGLRHGYIPGLLMESGPLPSHVRFRHSEWLGYARLGPDIQWAQVKLYGSFRNAGKVCAIK